MGNIYFQYHFHAVGQGLFSSGILHGDNNGQYFKWVFDCGTSSKKENLERELICFRETINNSKIDLFCLSHFDEDHINGARELLSTNKVETLVMPYFPLVERIQIAFGKRDISDDFMRFLISPAEYLFDNAGGNLTRIFFISGKEPPYEDSEAREGPGTSRDGDWNLIYPYTKIPTPLDEIEPIASGCSQKPWAVLSHQKPFRVSNEWEFYFYNKNIPENNANDLNAEVIKIIKRNRKWNGLYNGKKLLSELRIVYIKKFGSSGLKKNAISLIAYSGPIRKLINQDSVFCRMLQTDNLMSDSSHYHIDGRLSDSKKLKVSIIYFGDYPLNTKEEIRKIRNHFQKKRWEQTQVIQVPHHGSQQSWYPGAAQKFRHRLSVISAGLYSKNHPSHLVLNDLLKRCPILVNERKRLYLFGRVTDI